MLTDAFLCKIKKCKCEHLLLYSSLLSNFDEDERSIIRPVVNVNIFDNGLSKYFLISQQCSAAVFILFQCFHSLVAENVKQWFVWTPKYLFKEQQPLTNFHNVLFNLRISSFQETRLGFNFTLLKKILCFFTQTIGAGIEK